MEFPELTRPAAACNNETFDEISVSFYSILNMPFEFISFVWWRWLVECVHGKITQSHRTESFKPTYYSNTVSEKPVKHARAQTTSITSVANLFINHKGVLNHKYAQISVNTCKRISHPPLSVWPERGCHLSSAGVNLQTLWSTITLPEINDI